MCLGESQRSRGIIMGAFWAKHRGSYDGKLFLKEGGKMRAIMTIMVICLALLAPTASGWGAEPMVSRTAGTDQEQDQKGVGAATKEQAYCRDGAGAGEKGLASINVIN